MKNNNVDYKHPFTVWEIIKKEIELKIIKNYLTTSDKVPSINQISKEYDVSNSTAVKVLESLREEEIITKQKGVGYFVMPFAKQKLVSKHKKETENQLRNIFSLAENLEISEEELKSMTIQLIEQTYTHRE